MWRVKESVMSRVFSLLVIFICTWTVNANIIQTRPEEACKDNGGHISSGICCSNCPAGTYVKQPCNSASNRSECEPCRSGSYTEHSNGLYKCLPCSLCRSDQELVTKCTITSNTLCQCKAGSFCLPDQACEICKTCTKCKEDEKQVNSCTPQSNTVCQKKDAGKSIATIILIIAVPVVIVLLLIGGGLLWWKSPECCSTLTKSWQRQMKKTCSSNMDEERQNELNRELESGSQNRPIPVIYLSQPHGEGPVTYEEEEEDRGLGQSLPNTTTSSRESLPLLQLPTGPEPEGLPRLVPLNGEESLRKSFDLFTEIDVNFQNRFFRRIGLKDNDIRSTGDFRPEDRVYELLRVWIEKVGMAADFNDLLCVLLDLNQRLTAENIHTRVRADGLFDLENMK